MINMYTTYYYTLLQQLILHCYLYCFIELLAVLFLCFKTRVKMLVFDRLSTFPLTLVLLSNSPLYSLFIHFDTSCILLSSLGLSLAEYARYSRLLYFPFSLCQIGRCSRRWIPRAGVPRRRLLRRLVPH